MEKSYKMQQNILRPVKGQGIGIQKTQALVFSGFPNFGQISTFLPFFQPNTEQQADQLKSQS